MKLERKGPGRERGDQGMKRKVGSCQVGKEGARERGEGKGGVRNEMKGPGREGEGMKGPGRGTKG